jgi:transposase
MISREKEKEILRLYHAEKWPIGTIGTQLEVHHCTVRRVLAQAGLEGGLRSTRPSMADPYIPFIVEQLKKYPRLTASRLYQMVKERGYPGAPDHFRAIVARHRPRKPAEAYLRLRTLPGEQAQVDWGHFGQIAIGNAMRKLLGFVMVLSFSRMVFLRFYLNAAMPNFIRGHVDAFQFFTGVPRVALYDNLKSAVLERVGDAIRFHPTMLELAGHYHYEPRPVAPARGNEKGRVERAIRYIRDSFFAARNYTDIDDLNSQAIGWCLSVSADRKCPEDPNRTVRQVFEDEKSNLLTLPDNPFPSDEQQEVKVGKTPYVRFDLNDYSVPSKHVRRSLLAVASLQTVRVVNQGNVVATHQRSFDRGQVIEDPAHIQQLVETKRKAREHRGIDRLYHAVPASRELMIQLAQRGGNLGSTTSGLLRLLDQFGPSDLATAITEALERGTVPLGAVRHIVDQRRHARGQPPPIGPHLPNDPRLRDQQISHHSPASYDQFEGGSDEEE